MNHLIKLWLGTIFVNALRKNKIHDFFLCKMRTKGSSS